MAKFFRMGVWERVKLFIGQPSPDVVEYMVMSGLTGLPPAKAAQYIRDGVDILPNIIRVGWFDRGVIKPWIRLIIRKNWDYIRYYLVGYDTVPESGPPGLIARMHKADSVLYPLFKTEAGWRWLSWSCYHLAIYLRDYVGMKDDGSLHPPPFPDPIRH